MQVLPFIIAMTFVALPVGEGPIVLLEEGLSCSKIHSERVVSAEETLIYFGAPVDKAGNHYYMIDPDAGYYNSGGGTTITKFTESGDGSIFATLDPPVGHTARFEALTFDRRGNMIVAVLLQRKEPSWQAEVRDYYRIEGMPRSKFAEKFAFIVSVAILTLVLIISFFNLRSLFKSRRTV